MLTQNVTLIRRKMVDNRIHNYLASLTDLTRANYETDIKQFFRMMRNKNIYQLTEDDLKFDGDDIKMYRNKLCELYTRKNTIGELEPVSSTINRKMQAVKSLFFELSPDLPFIRMEIFNVRSLKKKTLKMGSLSYDEFLTMVELAKEFEVKGIERSLCIELAGQTGIRQRAILDITPKNFTNIKGYWVLEVYDKGQKRDRKTIPNDLYERLQAFRKSDNERYFTISGRTMLRTVQELARKMGLDPKRNICFHSLKKMGINWIINATGSLELGKEHGNHASIATLEESYREIMYDPSKSTSLMIGKKADFSILEQLSKEEIIEVIRKSSIGTQFEIINSATRK